MPPKPRPAIERLMQKLAKDDAGCWIYTGAIGHAGYGVIGLGGRAQGVDYTHRVAYRALVGEIPEGLHIDHLCRNRACCNPEHLEAVTQAENNRRAYRDNPRTHCRRGHEYTPETFYATPKQRICRTCRAMRYARKAAS